MKKWEMPEAYIEKFTANEYVAACITATVVCAIPGSSSRKVNDGTSARSNHGICGTAATITFNGDTATGYEVTNGTVNTNRPIYDIYINGTNTASGTYSNFSGGNQNWALGTYSAIWKSDDNEYGSGTYSHYGMMTITNIDSTRPNHS